MSSSAALKKQEFEASVQTQDLAGEQIVANNDVHSLQLTDRQIETVRSRIKSARLEHLMARQLETDLAIELTVAPQLENEIMAAMSATTNQFETEIEALEPYTAAIEEQETFKKNREECHTLVAKFQGQTHALRDLVDSSSDLLTFVARIEAEFKNAETARTELNEALIELENFKITNNEQSKTLDQQTRQISVLEALQESLSHNFSDAKSTILHLQTENQRTKQALREAQNNVAELTQANSQLAEQTKSAQYKLENTGTTIQSLREQLLEKEQILSETSEQARRISQETETEKNAFSDLKARYDRLNVKSLEYQGQHLSRINELEQVTADLKEDLDVARRDKNNLGSELDAVNKLLMLHGEMLDNLSSHALDRSKH